MTRGEKVCAFIQAFCRVPEGKLIGSPLKLAPFQRQFLLDVYDNPEGTSTAYLSIARKNGKTGLIAGMVLAHLVGPEARQNSQIVSGAMSREQAGIVFALACKMIQLNPDLADLVHIIPSSKRLIGKPMNVEYKALAAEGKTTHGLSPVLAILDEVGQVRGPHSDFIDAITTAQGAHDNPLLIAISTQAASDADLFSLWLDDASRSNDPHIVSHVYAAEEEAELLDEAQWAKANPALEIFRSLPDLKKQAERAARMPSSENTFRNLCLNQRVSVISPFVSRDVWQSCGDPHGPVQGQEVYCGLDLSSRTDLTTMVLIWQDGGKWHVQPHFWTPEDGLYDRSKRDRQPYEVWVNEGFLKTTPGATVDYGFVVQDMADILAECNVAAIAYDRWRIDILRREAEKAGFEFPLIEFGQGFKDMSPAIDALESEMLNGRVCHGMHPVLTMCAANAVVTKDPAGNRKLDKSKANGRIDGMVALAMAFGVSSADAEEDITGFLESPLVL
jgi:phage terminase large subunit-like protein